MVSSVAAWMNLLPFSPHMDAPKWSLVYAGSEEEEGGGGGGRLGFTLIQQKSRREGGGDAMKTTKASCSIRKIGHVQPMLCTTKSNALRPTFFYYTYIYEKTT